MEATIKAVIFTLGVAALIVVLAFLFMLPVYFLWNWLMPILFGLKEITMWQAWGISVLCGLLFKSSSSIPEN